MPVDPGQVNLGELKVRALYTCPSSVNVGQPVYQTGGSPEVDSADNSTSAKMPAIGIVGSKPTSTSCWVVSQGSVEKTGWGLSIKQTYFVGVSGSIVTSAGLPTAPGSFIQELGFGKSSDILFVQVDRDYSQLS